MGLLRAPDSARADERLQGHASKGRTIVTARSRAREGSTHPAVRRARVGVAGLLAAVVVAALPSVAGAASLAYIDGGEVWLASLDGSQKSRLSGGDGNWQNVAASDGGRVAAVQHVPGQLSQYSTFRVWAADGAVAFNGALSAKGTYQSYAYPLSFDISADGNFLVYGFSASNTFGFIAFTAGFYARSVDNAVLDPMEVSNATYPSFVGSRVVAAFGSEVRLQDPATVPFGTQFSFWINTIGTGLQLRRTDVAANGTLVASELHSNGPPAVDKITVLSVAGVGGALTGAVDCFLPTVGLAKDVSISQDATRIAWKDDEGVKVAGVPTTTACTLSSPAVVISPTGTSPSIGGGNLAGLGGLPPASVGALSVGLTAPSAPKLGALLQGKKVKFRFTVSAPCRGKARILVKKAEAKRLKLGAKDTLIGAAAANVPAAGTYPATLTIAKKYRAKLRTAKRVVAFVVVSCQAADGSTDAASRRVIFKR